MVGINIIGDKTSGTVPHLSSKKSSKKPSPKEMKTAMFIIFGLLIGIILFLGYWKMSSELDSIKKLIKIQNNMQSATTTASTTTAITTTTTATTSSTTTTFEKEEFGLKSCDDNDDVLTWLKCEKIRDREISRRLSNGGMLFTLICIGVIFALAICCSICENIYRCLQKRIKDRNTEVVEERIPYYPSMLIPDYPNIYIRPEPVPKPDYFWPNQNRL